MKLLFTTSLLFIKIQFFPNIQFILWMSVAIVLDFVTGIVKSKAIGQARTSAGYRKTIVKFFQYAGAITCGVVLQHVGSINEGTRLLLGYMNDFLLIFITYIEVTSIFENLYAIDSGTMIAKYFYAPVLKILTFQIKNNPVLKQAESLKEKQTGNNEETGSVIVPRNQGN